MRVCVRSNIRTLWVKSVSGPACGTPNAFGMSGGGHVSSRGISAIGPKADIRGTEIAHTTDLSACEMSQVGSPVALLRKR